MGVFKTPNYWMMCFFPTVIFAIAICVYGLLYKSYPLVSYGLTGFIVVFCFILFLFKLKSNVFVALGATGLLAVICGTALGFFIYDTCDTQTSFYLNTQTYTNVVPSEPSAGIADAGKIVFSSESKVNGKMSVGYQDEDGTKYCVAPVVDHSNAKRVAFWAVGTNCCEAGEFTCNAAKDPTAHAGIVIFDNLGLFGDSDKDFYEKARKQAEARHGLKSMWSPLFVQWVKEENLNAVSDYYSSWTVTYLLVFILDYLIFSSLLAYGLWKGFSLSEKS